MSADIFISYSSKDFKTAQTMCAALETRGFKCWWSSRDIEPGADFAESIVRAIRAAKVMLFIFSENSNNSDEVKKEIALASQYKLIVIPLRVEDITPNEALSFQFATRQWIDFFDDWESALEQLTLRIGKVVPPVILPPPEPDPDDDTKSDDEAAARKKRRTRVKPLPEPEPEPQPQPVQNLQAEAALSRGDAYAKIGQYDLAVAEYAEALRFDPQMAKAYHNRGAARQAKGANELAITDFDMALRLKPDYASALNNRGNAKLSLTQYDAALQDFDEAIRLTPDSANFYNNRGFAWFTKGDYDRALNDFDEAIRLKPDLIMAYENRARTYDKRGLAGKAQEDRNTIATLAGKSSGGGGQTFKLPPVPSGLKPWQIALIAIGGGLILLFIIIAAWPKPQVSDDYSSYDSSSYASDSSSSSYSSSYSYSNVADGWTACNGNPYNLDACNAIINDNSASAWYRSNAYDVLGINAYNGQLYDAAIGYYTNSLNISENSVVRSNLGLAYAYRDQGDDASSAMSAFNTAIDTDANNADAYHGRGTLEQKKGWSGADADLATAKNLGYKE